MIRFHQGNRVLGILDHNVVEKTRACRLQHSLDYYFCCWHLVESLYGYVWGHIPMMPHFSVPSSSQLTMHSVFEHDYLSWPNANNKDLSFSLNTAKRISN